MCNVMAMPLNLHIAWNKWEITLRRGSEQSLETGTTQFDSQPWPRMTVQVSYSLCK